MVVRFSPSPRVAPMHRAGQHCVLPAIVLNIECRISNNNRRKESTLVEQLQLGQETRQQAYEGAVGKCSPEPESAQIRCASGPAPPTRTRRQPLAIAISGVPRQQPCRALAGEVSEAVCVHPHHLLDELPTLNSCSSLMKFIGADFAKNASFAASSRLYLKTDEHVLLVPGPRAATPKTEKFCLCRRNTAHVRNNARWRANLRPSATWMMASKARAHSFASIPDGIA